MSKKLNVYLADLIHDRHIYNYSVPLNVGYITAMLKQSLKDEVDSKIFKFPDELIQGHLKICTEHSNFPLQHRGTQKPL